jgi:hypothetical protein
MGRLAHAGFFVAAEDNFHGIGQIHAPNALGQIPETVSL